MITLRVFLSSTFKDMMEEREELVTRVFPELRRFWEKKGVHLVEVDLRWGVPDELPSLEVCLDEVDACRPLFVGFLGHLYGSLVEREVLQDDCLLRYGWMRREEHAGRSYTELEIIHAVLRVGHPAMDCLFYMRDESYSARLAAEHGWKEDTAENRAKLERLKAELKVREFSPRQPYQSSAELGRWIEEDLNQLIERRVAESMPGEAWAQRRGRLWAGDMRVMSRLANAVTRWLKPPPLKAAARGLVVWGAEGSGKSALLAAWAAILGGCRYKVLQASAAPEMLTGEEILLLGADTETPDIDEAARLRQVVLCLSEEECASADGQHAPEEKEAELAARWLGYIRDRWLPDLAVPGPQKPMRVFYALQSALRRLPADARLLVVVDASSCGGSYAWLPDDLPPSVFVAVSVKEETDAVRLAEQRKWQHMGLPGRLPAFLLQMLVKIRLIEHGKRLSEKPLFDVVALLGQVPPRWTSLVLADLRRLPTREKVPPRIGELECASGDPGELGRLMVDALGDTSSPERMWDAVGLMLLSKGGLAEMDLRAMLGSGGKDLAAAEWSPMYLSLRDWLQPGDGLLVPTPELRLAWQAHLRRLGEQAGRDKRIRLWRKLVDFFFQLGPGNRRAVEQMQHLYSRSQGLRSLVSDPNWLGALWRHQREGLRTLLASPLLGERESWLAGLLQRQPEEMPATALAAVAEQCLSFPRFFSAALDAARRAIGGGEGEAVLFLSRHLTAAGRTHDALEVLEKHLPALREMDAEGTSRALADKAALLLKTGRKPAALWTLREAVILAERSAEPRTLMKALRQLGELTLEEGSPREALPFFKEQERVARIACALEDRIEARRGQAECLRLMNGCRAEAMTLLRELVEQVDHGRASPHLAQSVIGSFIEVLRDDSKLGEATQWLLHREKLIDKVDDMMLRVEVLMQRAGICRDRGDTATASGYYEQALALARLHGMTALVEACIRALKSLFGS